MAFQDKEPFLDQASGQIPTVPEISGSSNEIGGMGGQFGQDIQSAKKTHHPAGTTGKPQSKVTTKVEPLITILEKEPISLRSRVFRAICHSRVTGDRPIIAKIIPAGKKNEREAKIHFLVPHHQNIVERIATNTFSYRGQPSIYIAMELCDSNLYDYIMREVENEIPFDSEKYISIAHQIVAALDFLHSHKIIHRDLKPNNVLVMANGKLVKLSDFGLSKDISDGRDSTNVSMPRAGTQGWQSPEAIKGVERISTATDIFPCGLVLHFVWSYGKHPFGDKSYSRSFFIAEGKNRNLSQLLILCVEIAKPLLEWMLENDPKKRPTTKEILQHEIFISLGLGKCKVTDSKLCGIVSNAIDGIPTKELANETQGQVNKDVQKMTELGVTTGQLTKSIKSVIEEKKLKLAVKKQVSDVELHDSLDMVVKSGSGSNEETPLGVTVNLLANAMETAQQRKNLHLAGIRDRKTTLKWLHGEVQKIVSQTDQERPNEFSNETVNGVSTQQLADAMKKACEKKKIQLTASTQGVLLLSPNANDEKQLVQLTSRLYGPMSPKIMSRFICCDDKSEPEKIQNRLPYMGGSEDGITTIIIAYRAATVPLRKALEEESLKNFLDNSVLNSSGSVSMVRRKLAVFTLRPWDFICNSSAVVAANICLTTKQLDEPFKFHTEQEKGEEVSVITLQRPNVGSSLEVFTHDKGVIELMRKIIGLSKLEAPLFVRGYVYSWQDTWKVIVSDNCLYLKSISISIELVDYSEWIRYLVTGQAFSVFKDQTPKISRYSDLSFFNGLSTGCRRVVDNRKGYEERPFSAKLEVKVGNWSFISVRPNRLAVKFTPGDTVIFLDKSSRMFMVQWKKSMRLFGPDIPNTWTNISETQRSPSKTGCRPKDRMLSSSTFRRSSLSSTYSSPARIRQLVELDSRSRKNMQPQKKMYTPAQKTSSSVEADSVTPVSLIPNSVTLDSRSQMNVLPPQKKMPSPAQKTYLTSVESDSKTLVSLAPNPGSCTNLQKTLIQPSAQETKPTVPKSDSNTVSPSSDLPRILKEYFSVHSCEPNTESEDLVSLKPSTHPVAHDPESEKKRTNRPEIPSVGQQTPVTLVELDINIPVSLTPASYSGFPTKLQGSSDADFRIPVQQKSESQQASYQSKKDAVSNVMQAILSEEKQPTENWFVANIMCPDLEMETPATDLEFKQKVTLHVTQASLPGKNPITKRLNSSKSPSSDPQTQAPTLDQAPEVSDSQQTSSTSMQNVSSRVTETILPQENLIAKEVHESGSLSSDLESPKLASDPVSETSSRVSSPDLSFQGKHSPLVQQTSQEADSTGRISTQSSVSEKNAEVSLQNPNIPIETNHSSSVQKTSEESDSPHGITSQSSETEEGQSPRPSIDDLFAMLYGNN